MNMRSLRFGFNNRRARKGAASLVVALFFTLFFMVMTTLSASAQEAYTEAPELAAQVAAGELPPVAERLPATPMVVEPNEEIGVYGGEWRNAILAGDNHQWVYRNAGYEHLVRVNVDFTEVIPNIAESFEANDDATEFTFKLRDGMKWSDGEPFTSADIMFWYDDVLMNEELTLSFPSWLMAGGEPVVVEAPDATTVIFRFASPNGLFLDNLAGQAGLTPTMLPRHYLEQFHKTYNPDGVDALVRASGAADWPTFFEVQAGLGGSSGNTLFTNAERPVLFAWRPVNSLGQGERFVMERNPYYWKIDPEGQQLPYIDSIVYDVVGDAEVLLLKTLNGEIDLMSRSINELSNKPVLFDNVERGNYDFFTLGETGQNYFVLSLNLTHQDPIKREVFQNKDFRIGLSHAINRQEIIDLVYLGQGEPAQVAPRPTGPYYNEQLSKQYTEYDPDLANEFLDKAGYSERDAQGFRLGPDGERISIIVEAYSFMGPWADALELIKQYWAAVGVDMQYRTVDAGLFDERVQSNEHDANLWWSGAGLKDILLENFNHIPSSWASTYAVEWGTWHQNHAEGEEPPEAVKAQMDMLDQLQITADAAEQETLMKAILEVSAEEFYNMGVSLSADEYGIVSNRMHNVPDYIVGVPAIGPGQANSEQFFFDSESQ